MSEIPALPESHAIRRAFFGPTELRAGWRLAIFMAVVLALSAAFRLATQRAFAGLDGSTRFLVREVVQTLIWLSMSWIMGRFEGRSLATYGLPWRRMFRARFWQGALLGFVALTVLLLSMTAVGVFRVVGVALRGGAIWGWAGVYALVFLLVGLSEEFRLRGYTLFTLATGIRFWPAAVVTSVMFGLGHAHNTGESWIGVVNTGLFGLFACLLLLRTGDLWLPIGFHMTFDWGETYFYGVANSGHVPEGHLLDSASSGPAWLSGGSVGPEGSVLCTALFVVAWLACARWLRETRYVVRGASAGAGGAMSLGGGEGAPVVGEAATPEGRSAVEAAPDGDRTDART